MRARARWLIRQREYREPLGGRFQGWGHHLPARWAEGARRLRGRGPAALAAILLILSDRALSARSQSPSYVSLIYDNDARQEERVAGGRGQPPREDNQKTWQGRYP